MVLIALAMVSLLAMAALAIDITTLLAVRSEAQNAADAAALAGAKMFVTSGITSLGGAAPPIAFTDVCLDCRARKHSSRQSAGGGSGIAKQRCGTPAGAGRSRVTARSQRTLESP